MLLARALSRRLWNLQRQGRVTTVTPIDGHEAAAVGVIRSLDLSVDWVVPYYREMLGFAAFGDEYLTSIVSYWRGHPNGGRAPDNARVLPPQISLASQIPHAAGLAWGLRLRQEPGVVCAFIGDGATSEGDFYEGLNLAGVQRAPLVVVVVNNGWAISTPTHRQTAARSIAAKADAVGARGMRVDGNDVLAVIDASTTARSHAASQGPVLLELETYRVCAHTNSDDPTRYVPPADLEHWRAHDPIDQFRARLTAEHGWSLTDISEVEAAVDERVERITAAALEYPLDPRSMFEEIYDAEPARLGVQRHDLEERLGLPSARDLGVR